MNMLLRFVVVSLLMTLFFSVVELYKLGEPIQEPTVEIIFEADEYDTTQEIFMVDLK
jgi:hypothetical protein